MICSLFDIPFPFFLKRNESSTNNEPIQTETNLTDTSGAPDVPDTADTTDTTETIEQSNQVNQTEEQHNIIDENNVLPENINGTVESLNIEGG